MTLADRALQLVSIPSVIGDEKRLADFVETWAKQHFAPEEILRVSHSLVLGKRDDGRPSIALVGHLDTVPENSEPNPPRIEGDRLYGLGASDMKGAVAVMMALAESLPRAQLPVNVLFVLYEREEGPYLESGLGPLFDAAPELKKVAFAIAMEPTDGAVQVGCVGSLHATVRVTGKAAHSARPWQGKNAIHEAGALLVDLARRERVPVNIEGHTFYEVLSATLCKGGRARNVVADSFEVNLNYRFAPGKTVEAAQRDVLEFVGARGEVTFTDLAPSGKLCGGNAYYQALLARTGRPAEAKQAWTDVARLSEWGLDAVNYGPGETAQAHQRAESASVAALQQSFDVLRELLTGSA